MSRWDTLKKDDEPKGTNSRWNQSSKSGRSNLRRPKHHVEGRSLVKKAFVSSSRSCQEVVAALHNSTSDDTLELSALELARLSQQELQKLPAEEAANNVVDSILLQALGSAEASSRLERGIIEALTRIIQESSLCSAIVSPLTLNVDEETGMEEKLSNPIGERILNALQGRLPRSCNALTIMIDQLHKRCITDTLPLDLRKLQTYFEENIASSQTLTLLRVVLQAYADSYKILKTLLFSDFRRKSILKPCLECQYGKGRAPLLDLLHSRKYESAACIGLLISACPLQQWLNPKAAGSMQLFGLSVKNDLIELMRIMVCRFTVQEDFCKLLSTVLTVIPYVGNQKDELTLEGMKLVASMADFIMKHPNAAALLDSFCECMGGRPQPSGGNSPTSKPLALWLKSDASSTFQEYIFSSGNEPTSCSFSSAMKLLCTIIRIQPEFLSWQQFCVVVPNNISKVRHRVDGMLLLEQFALGRSDNVAHQFALGRSDNAAHMTAETSLVDKAISRYLLCTFRDLASDQSSKVRLSCLRGYCSLVWNDWLFAIQSEYIDAAVNHLIRFCEHGTSSEKPLAFKAVGEMLSKCCRAPESGNVANDDQLSNLCDSVLPVLKNGLQETAGAATRSMAVFAVGNLALGIRERNSQTCVLSDSDLADLMDLTCTCIDASNDKVAGNSIRTIGHLGFAAFHKPFLAGPTILSSAIERHRIIVKMLTKKIRNAIGGTASARLTWKERSSAKKHGWGACHSLGHMLDCELIMSNLEESREACAALISCIQQYSSLSEKIVLAAIAALQRLQLNQLECLSRRTGLVGLAVSCCLQAILNWTTTTTTANQRLKKELEGFLQRTIPVLSVLDARTILQTESISARHLEWLYDWMVANKVKSEPYEMLAMAFEQDNPWNSDMSLEQRFASRAAWSHREQGTDDDNDDEL